MPQLTTTEDTAIRTFPQTTRKYLSVFPEIVLFSARIDGVAETTSTPTATAGIFLDSISSSIFMFRYKDSSGDPENCYEGMRILVGTTPGGKEIGTTTLRGPIDDVNLLIPINETPYGQLTAVDEAYITVIENFCPAQRTLRLQALSKGSSGILTDFIEYHDYDEVYVDQNVNIVPIANINRPSTEPGRKLYAQSAGFVDATTEMLRLKFTAIHSRAMVGTNPLQYEWSIGDGTYVTGSATTAEIEVDFPVGARHIRLIVTDTVTGKKSPARYHPVIAHDRTTFTPFENNDRGFNCEKDSRKEGRRMSFRIFGQNETATDADLPYGALIVYWEEPYFYTSAPPETYVGQFTGWLFVKSITPVKNAGTVTIDVLGVEGWLSEVVNGFNTQLTDFNRLPRKWFEMEDITCNKVIHYLLREYSTALLSANLYLPLIDGATDRAETAAKDKLFNQLTTVAAAYGNLCRADSNNGIWIEQDVYYLTDRSTVPVITILTASDLTLDGLSVTQREARSVGLVIGSGSSWDGVAAEPVLMKSHAPGNYAGDGDGQEEFFWRVDSQTELNYKTGQLYARRNSRFESISVTLIGNYDVFEAAWGELVQLEYNEDNTAGYVIPSSLTFVIEDVSVAHSNSEKSPSKRITLTLAELTDGVPGLTQKIEKEEWVAPSPVDTGNWTVAPLPPLPDTGFTIADFTPPVTPENPTPDPLPVGFCVTATGNDLYRTFEFLSDDVVWQKVTPPAEKGMLLDYCAKLNPATTGNVVAYAFYLTSPTTFTFWRCSNIKAPTVSWTKEATRSFSGGAFNNVGTIDCSANGVFAAAAWLCENGVRVFFRDNGVWSASATACGSLTTTDANFSSKDLQLLVDGTRTVCSGLHTTSNKYQLFTSTAGGAFSVISGSPTFDAPCCSLTARGTTLYLSSWAGALAEDAKEEEARSIEGSETPADGGVPGGAYDCGSWSRTYRLDGETLPPEVSVTRGTFTAGVGVMGNFAGGVSGVSLTITEAVAYTLSGITFDADLTIAVGGTSRGFYENAAFSLADNLPVGSYNGARFYGFTDIPGVTVINPVVQSATVTDSGSSVVRAITVHGKGFEPGMPTEIITMDAANPPTDLSIAHGTIDSGGFFDSGIRFAPGYGNVSWIICEGKFPVSGLTQVKVFYDSPDVEAIELWIGDDSLVESFAYPVPDGGEYSFTLPTLTPLCGDTFILNTRVATGPWGGGGNVSPFKLLRIEFTQYESSIPNSSSPSSNNAEKTVTSSPEFTDGATYPLIWDTKDDDPKHFSETDGFVTLRWTFDPSQPVDFSQVNWYTYIKYLSDDSTKPENNTRLVVKWNLSAKFQGQTELVKKSGSVTFVRAGTSVSGTVGNYTRVARSSDMLSGITTTGKRLEYLEARAEIVPTAVGLATPFRETLKVPVDGTTVATKGKTTVGTSYRVKVSGTAIYGDVPPQPFVVYTDGVYSSTTAGGGGWALQPDVRLQMNGVDLSAPAYNPAHEYVFTLAGTGNAIEFRFRDVDTSPGLYHTDNTGELKVEVEEVSTETKREWRIEFGPYGASGSPRVVERTASSGSRSCLYRVANYATTPVFTNITPTNKKVSQKKHGLTVDKITAGTLYVCGQLDSEPAWVMKSTDNGVTWQDVDQSGANWIIVFDVVKLQGSSNLLRFTPDNTTTPVSRIGDLYRENAGRTPYIRHCTLAVD
jgi:hypothetical protein